MVENVNPPELGPPIGFSHVTRAGGFVFLGGQTGCGADGEIVEPGDMAAQFSRALRNVGIALRAAGTTPDRTVKLTYFVTDVEAYRTARPEIGATYREVFGKHFPAMSLFGVSELLDPQALVEIECVALAGEA